MMFALPQLFPARIHSRYHDVIQVRLLHIVISKNFMADSSTDSGVENALTCVATWQRGCPHRLRRKTRILMPLKHRKDNKTAQVR